MTFEDLICPHSSQEFLTRILGRSALYASGAQRNLDYRFSWNELNRLLEFGSLGHPRARRFHGALECPPQNFVSAGRNGYSRMLVRELTAAIRGGATLAIDCVDDLSEPASHICRLVEQQIGTPVQADLYAVGSDAPSADLRWNDHDVLVLQLEGQRKWSIHAPTRATTRDSGPSAPAGGADWTGELGQTDALYMPRGWWYLDESAGPAALFLALKFRFPTAADAIQSFAQRSCQERRLDVSIPLFGPPDEHAAVLKILQREFEEATAKPGLLLATIAEQQLHAEPRARFSFPWILKNPPLADHLLVVSRMRFPSLSSVRHLEWEDTFELSVDGRGHRFPERIFPVIQRLCESRPITVGKLFAHCKDRLRREEFDRLLLELVLCGAICLNDSNSSSDSSALPDQASFRSSPGSIAS